MNFLKPPLLARYVAALGVLAASVTLCACGDGSKSRGVATTTPTGSLLEQLPTPAGDIVTLPGAGGFTSLEQAEEELGWSLLESTDRRFSFDSFTATYLDGATGSPAGARTSYFTDASLQRKLVFIQALESFGLPVPTGTTRVEKIGAFDVTVWTRADGSPAGVFNTGARAGDENVVGFVNADDEAQLRRFLETLNFVN